MINFSQVQNIHMIGIGGIGISSLTRVFLSMGKHVSGSDLNDSLLLDGLKSDGVKVFIGHQEANLREQVELVVISPAILKDNVELVKAQKLKIPVLTYPEALGILTREYFTIAISGTHGKSTTTALISLILTQNNFDPTVVIGTKLKEFDNKNVRIGKSKYLIVEACEYRRAFLNLAPNMIVVTNIEAEHLDYYQDLVDYKSAFTEFINKLPDNGYVVANYDDINVRQAIQDSKQKFKLIRFGSGLKDFRLLDKTIFEKDEKIGDLNLRIPGEHNLKNALAAYSVARILKLEPDKIINSLNKYQGSWRRFEFKGYFNQAEIYDDYAHHPTEIKATLLGAREFFPKKRIICVFQPHQYSRTKKLLKDFSQAFNDADLVIVPNIYEVRDSFEDVKAITAYQLVMEIKKYHKNVVFGDGFDKTVQFLKSNLNKDEVVLTMGAGDVWKVGEALLSRSVAM